MVDGRSRSISNIAAFAPRAAGSLAAQVSGM